MLVTACCLLVSLCALSAAGVIARFDGEASRRTAEFDATGPWLLTWNARSSNEMPKVFEMRLWDADSGDFLGKIEELRDVGAGRKLFDEPGRFVIEVVAQNVAWTLVVSDVDTDQAARAIRRHEGEQTIEDTAKTYAKRLREDAFESWRPVDDSTLLLFEADDARGYRVTFASPCAGLSGATALSFVTADIRDVALYDAIMLEDGTYCAFDRVVPTIFE